MQKNKIVHISSSLRMGGAEKVLYTLVKHLKNVGYEQTVFYFHAGPFVEQIRSLGVPTKQIKGILCIYDPFFFMRLLLALWHAQPSLVHTLLWAANVSGRICATLLRIRVISSYHNNVDQDGFFRSIIDRMTQHCATHIVAVSEQVAASIIKRSCDPHRLSVIVNGIENIHKDFCVITKSQLGISKNSFVIGAVGRFVPVKRFDYLLEVYAQSNLENSTLVLIGSGPCEQYLRAKIHTLNLDDRVTIIDDNALPYYALFDCFVQSSVKEGISLALLEAMSFAKGVVVMGEDHYHSVVTDAVDGLIVPPYDAQKLTDALQLLYTNEHMKATLGAQAQIIIQERFSADEMVNKYAIIFQKYALRRDLETL